MDDLAVEISRRSLDQLEKMHGRVATDVAALIRWILAALFALNCIALIWLAIMHSNMEQSTMLKVTCIFGCGALIAVLAAVFSIIFGITTLRSVGYALTSLTGVELLQYHPEESNVISSKLLKIDFYRRTTTLILGAASFLTFIVGMAQLVSYFYNYEETVSPRPLSGASPEIRNIGTLPDSKKSLDREVKVLPKLEQSRPIDTPKPSKDSGSVKDLKRESSAPLTKQETKKSRPAAQVPSSSVSPSSTVQQAAPVPREENAKPSTDSTTASTPQAASR